jgi:hypothetical protein
VLAAFGIVLELFVVEEQLFSRGENEIGFTVNAFKDLVNKVHAGIPLPV